MSHKSVTKITKWFCKLLRQHPPDAKISKLNLFLLFKSLKSLLLITSWRKPVNNILRRFSSLYSLGISFFFSYFLDGTRKFKSQQIKFRFKMNFHQIYHHFPAQIPNTAWGFLVKIRFESQTAVKLSQHNRGGKVWKYKNLRRYHSR